MDNITTVQPKSDFEYYQSHIFYTNFDVFSRRENRKISGQETVSWISHISQRYGTLGSAFVFSCGNGWVEREFFRQGIITDVVGFDVMQKYVDEAQAQSALVGLPSEYTVADANTFDGSDLRRDVVINSGAMHHIAFINRFTAQLARVCAGGYYVAYDYTGAHRNQYSFDLWHRILKIQEQIPHDYRVELNYPHMPTMLHLDPSEAVHSELQMEVLQRHFDLVEHVRLGGGIAHTLLLNNYALHRDQGTPEGRSVLEMIARADEDALRELPDANLFTFFVAKPKEHASSPLQLAQWQKEEDERENAAAANSGRYYDPTPLELIYNDMTSRLMRTRAAAEMETRSVRMSMEAQVEALRCSTSWRVTRPLRSLGSLIRHLRG